MLRSPQRSPTPGTGRGRIGILLRAIGHGMEADNRKGISIYADKMSQKIASDEVTIVDDGTILNARAPSITMMRAYLVSGQHSLKRDPT